jgi:hypothetical protein
VAQRLKEHARKRGISFKQAINEVARRGFDNGAVKPRPFKVKARDMKLRPGIDLTKANQLAAALEDAELIKRMNRAR